MNRLYQKSLHLILENQSDEGAFIACPNFKTYQYAWFRDGSYCAYALTKAGYLENASKFFDWSSGVVMRYQQKMESCIEAVKKGTPPLAENCLHSRFNADGSEVPGGWGHHQLDGLGTWLWAMGECIEVLTAKQIPENWRQSADLVVKYLSAMWKYPCSDCWEENENGIHTYTLASIAAGLTSYANKFHIQSATEVSLEVKRFIQQNCIHDGYFTKSLGSDQVDANLIALVYPCHLVEWNDPVFQRTLSKVTSELTTPIGVHRYLSDTYYGSGEWVLLTDWLGWSYANAGEFEKAETIEKWTEQQATGEDELPEQVLHGLFSEKDLSKWLIDWGPAASPLMWSHAMYVLLVLALKENTNHDAA